ncbi:hypothetical protein TVAG_280890 [Trichomonas vaginalis G3]|uniref:Wntless-like transmembrane domain-containing protein n=1 Tax=Trichomonas vaginalis (strain ATCC PRA-98 / G3) TaxID=412133 RepID=A2DRK9_TRIV3|nr:transmembrane protein 181 family [Trichomonas vaginalis G3]EAY16972.1 hypothetical protein TVAG_280890 [Trichomonas vaginalis G3]KAI5508981.1 transmembrane protein 181 family [Trichomonas vaginalis G3]|eukprot:XP_001329195.1 hypothetical protein [Trichomonas vaginalis G3]
MENLDPKNLKKLNMEQVNDVPILADLKCSSIFGFNLIFPYVIALILLFSGIFIAKPIYYSNFVEKVSIVDEKYTSEVTISKINQLDRFINVHASFNNVSSSQFLFSGDYHAITTLKEDTIFKLEEKTNNTMINVNNQVTDKIHLYSDYALFYDTLQLSLNLQSNVALPNAINIYVRKGNPNYSFMINIIKVVLSFIVAVYIVLGAKKVASRQLMLEQNLSFMVLSALIIFIDPFITLHLFYPLRFNQIRHLISRDIFVSYFIFFICYIYSLIGVEPSQDKTIPLLLPYMIGITYFVSVLATDTSFGGYRMLGSQFDPLTDQLFLNATIFFCYSAFFVYYLFISIKKIFTTSSIDKNRAINYFIASFPTVIVMEIYYSVLVFTNILKNTAYYELIPLAFYTCSVLVFWGLMSQIHEGDRYLYQNADRDNLKEEDNENPIGIDTENIPELPDNFDVEEEKKEENLVKNE